MVSPEERGLQVLLRRRRNPDAQIGALPASGAFTQWSFC
jgi:hypothetical protein